MDVFPHLLLEKVNRAKQLLIFRLESSGPEPEADAEYQAIRPIIVFSPRIQTKIPTILTSFRTLDEFRRYIDLNSKTNDDRHEYIRQQFDPLLTELEFATTSLAVGKTQSPSHPNADDTTTATSSDSGIAEKVHRLQSLLTRRATGKSSAGDTEEFQTLRSELMRLPVKSKLPTIAKSYRTLDEFWGFIKGKFGNYASRTEYIQQQFDPLLTELEQGNVGHAVAQASPPTPAAQLPIL